MMTPDRAALEQAFSLQAEHCRNLGSPFTADLCLLFAEYLDEKTAVGRHVLTWPGKPSHRADAVPLRLCGALHALVLNGTDASLVAAYPPKAHRVPTWPVIEAALRRHEDFILDWMRSPPQTNEVRRANAIWPVVQTVAERTGLPVALWEIGTSGGLNLRIDRFAFDHGGQISGTVGSGVHLMPEWEGPLPPSIVLDIVERRGCDLNPLDPSKAEDRLRLLAYLWAGQQDRVSRTGAAIELALQHPAVIDRMDAVEWLRERLPQRPGNAVTFLFTTIAWQYLPDAAKAEGMALIEAAGKSGAPLAFAQMEGDGESPGAAITLKLWPDGIDTIVGRVDFHGRWVKWYGL